MLHSVEFVDSARIALLQSQVLRRRLHTVEQALNPNLIDRRDLTLVTEYLLVLTDNRHEVVCDLDARRDRRIAEERGL